MILTRTHLGFRYAKSSAQKKILKRTHLGFGYAKSLDQKRFSSAIMHFDTYVIFISSQCCIPNVYHFTQKTLNLRSHSNTTESTKINPPIIKAKLSSRLSKCPSSPLASSLPPLPSLLGTLFTFN